MHDNPRLYKSLHRAGNVFIQDRPGAVEEIALFKANQRFAEVHKQRIDSLKIYLRE